MSNQRSRTGALLLVAAAVLVASIFWLGQPPTATAADEMPADPPFMVNPYHIADVAERVTPSVVYIEVTWPAQQRARSPFNDPFFREFFPFNPWPDASPQTSRGTGFIIDQEGHILTNQHVVGASGSGQTITVKLLTPEYSGEVEAELLGADYELDLAVLKIEKPAELKELPTVPLGDSDSSRPGEWTIAVGNPYGDQFEHTVTVGVLSAKGREIDIYDRERRQWRRYTNLMQTDAAINPGNSGGPLINIRGEVIGINTAVNAAAQGIGFAIPINTALDVMEQLIQQGKVLRPYLGIHYGPVTEEIAEALGTDSQNGAIIHQVEMGSAAYQAGLQAYDIVLRLGDTDIVEYTDVAEAISQYEPGDNVLILVWRRGQTELVPVTLGERPADL